MLTLPVPLRVVILDPNSASACALKGILENKPGVEEVALFPEIPAAKGAFQQGFNSLFIDLFSFDTSSSIDFIEWVRSNYPLVPICLWSDTADLIKMPGVMDEWRKRLEHYYKLPKDRTIQYLDKGAEQILEALATTLQIDLARQKVDSLAELTTVAPNHKELEEIVETIQSALESKGKRARSVAYTMVPGVNTGKIEELVNSTLDAAARSLNLTAKVNIAVLILGSLIVVSSCIVAFRTGQWQAVTFGGFGIAGIIAALISNPLKSIGGNARRLVQIQVAYLGFLSQLALLNHESDQTSEIERSQRLGEEVARTLQVLEQYFGS